MQNSEELTPLMKKRIYNREWKKRNALIKKQADYQTDGTNIVQLTPQKQVKSIVNRVTEYGALFNKLNDEQIKKGRKPLKTAMEVLIEAMQSPLLDLKEKARIAEKLATYESSRAPIISIEHVQNISNRQEETADESLDSFLTAIRKA